MGVCRGWRLFRASRLPESPGIAPDGRLRMSKRYAAIGRIPLLAGLQVPTTGNPSQGWGLFDTQPLIDDALKARNTGKSGT